LKSWRICGDTENISRTGRKQIVTKRAENTLSMVVKMSRRATLKDITAEFNERVPVAVSPRTVQRKLHPGHSGLQTSDFLQTFNFPSDLITIIISFVKITFFH
jgi:hypothetical protein